MLPYAEACAVSATIELGKRYGSTDRRINNQGYLILSSNLPEADVCSLVAAQHLCRPLACFAQYVIQFTQEISDYGYTVLGSCVTPMKFTGATSYCEALRGTRSGEGSMRKDT